MEKNKIFFVATIKKFIWDNKKVHFFLNDFIVSEENIKSHKIRDDSGYSIILNEFDISDNIIEEEDLENEEENKKSITIYLKISDKPNFKNTKEYETIIYYEPKRTNFIFDLFIGKSKKKTLSEDNSLEYLNIDFNTMFKILYSQMNEKQNKDQPDYIENLGKDTLNYLEEKKNEIFYINCEIMFFLLLYVKNTKNNKLYLKTFLEIFFRKQFNYNELKIYSKEKINEIITEIFTSLEESSKAWPFNEFQKFEKGFVPNEEEEEDEEEQKQEEDDKKEEYLNMTITEIKFMEFLLGYYSKLGGNTEDLKLFLMNDKIKNKTIKMLSQEKSQKYISNICRQNFMKLFDNKDSILEKLQIQTNLLEYFRIINEHFYDLSELIEKVGMNQFDCNFQNITLENDIKEIIEIHKEIIAKENKEKKNIFDFIPFINKCINVFKDNNLEQLIYLNEFIEDEKLIINYNNMIDYRQGCLVEAIKSTVNIYIHSNIKNYNLYLLEIIPKINKYLSERDLFNILNNIKLNGKDEENAKNVLDLIVKNKIFKYFYDKKRFFNAVVKNIKGIQYLKYITQISREIDDIADELYKWISVCIKNYKKSLNIDIKQDLFEIFIYLTKYNQASKLLKLIKNSINDQEMIDIFIYFLENIHLNKKDFDLNHYKVIIDCLLQDKKYHVIIPKIFSNEEIAKTEKIISYIFNILKNNILTSDEFYLSEKTEKIRLLEELININFFSKIEYQNYEFTKKTVEIINVIKSNFENGNLAYDKAITILNNFTKSNDFDYLYKFKLLFLSKEIEEENVIKISKQFKDDVRKVQSQIGNLEIIKSFLENFYPISKQKEISYIELLQNLFSNQKLNLYNGIIEQDVYKTIIKYLEEANTINHLNKESLCFKKIYEKEKNIYLSDQNEKNKDKEKEDENTILKNALEKFENLKSIFEMERIENINNDIQLLLDIYLESNDENKLYKQILFLKMHFNINKNEEDLKKIQLNIIIFGLSNIINYILLGLKEIYSLFKENINIKEEGDILLKMDDYLEKIKNADENMEINQIDEIISYLKNFNIYLLGIEAKKETNDTNIEQEEKPKKKIQKSNPQAKEEENNVLQYNIQNREKFYEFLKLIQNNPEAINFATTQKEKNAKFLLEFLIESDEKKNLQENDVYGFIKTVQFFEKILKEEYKYKFSELIKLLNNAITFTNDPNYLGEHINNYIKNYNAIKSLYLDSMDKSGSSSLIITSILTNSLAKVSYRNITIEYKKSEDNKNTLDIEALEELRGKAVIMKSYMKINNEQEIVLDNNYNNVKIFVELIQKFKILNNLLNRLYKIGIPEPDKYIIIININEKDIKTIIENNFDYSDINCSVCGHKYKLNILIDYLYNITIQIE